MKTAFIKTLAMLLMTLCSGFGFAQKATIAVGEIEYRAMDSSENKRYRAYSRDPREDTRAFVDMVTTALVKTNKFDVMERTRMTEILEEQGLSLQGIASGGYEGRGFNLQGVDYILIGAITEYGQEASSSQVGRFSMAGERAVMAVDVRVLDVAEGSIGFADTVKAEAAGGSGFAVKGLAQSGQSNQGSMLGQVMREAAQLVTNLIVSNIYPIKVVVVQSSGEIMLNYGNSMLSVGDVLSVFSQGEAFVDPDTGEQLGREEQLVGKISVVSVQPRFSKAAVLEGSGEIAKGMIARPTDDPDRSNGGAAAKQKKRRLW